MKRLTAFASAVLMVAALDAAAFFRNDRIQQRIDPPEPLEASAADGALKADACSLMIRYSPSTVAADLIHIHYAGTAECRSWWRAALIATGPLPGGQLKADSNGPAEAPAPVFECAINVNFSAATASSPTVLYTGAGSCSATREMARSSALRAVQQMCAVEFDVPCR